MDDAITGFKAGSPKSSSNTVGMFVQDRGASKKIKYGYNNLPPQLQTKINDLAEGLKRVGKLGNNADLNDPKTLKTVQQYMKNHDAVDITPRTSEVSTKAAKAELESISRGISSRVFFNPVTRKHYKYNEMVEEGFLSGNVNQDMKLMSYEGRLTSDNPYGEMIEDKGLSRHLTIPHAVNIADYNNGNKPGVSAKWVISPKKSEVDSPYHANEELISSRHSLLQNTADIPSKFTFYKDSQPQNVEIARVSKKSDLMIEAKKHNPNLDTSQPYLLSTNGSKIGSNGLPVKLFIGLSAEDFRNMQQNLK